MPKYADYATTTMLVLKATTFRFPRERYSVEVLPAVSYNPNQRYSAKEHAELPWRPAVKEGPNGFRLDVGFWYLRVKDVPLGKSGRPELYMGSVNSLPSYGFNPNYYLDGDPWPPPILPGDPDYFAALG